ncbi:MAG: hypothetical protein DPW11_02505 [bacterium]|nr:hypothetical protein [bacterium]
MDTIFAPSRIDKSVIKMITTNAHSLVGSSTKNSWSQAQSLTNNHQTVSLVINLKILGEEGVIDLASIGGAIFEKFHEQGKMYRTPVEWQEFLESELGDVTHEVEVSVVVVCIYDETVWLWGKGKTGARLYREGRFITLVEGDKWEEGLAGTITHNDILIIGTEKGIETSTEPHLMETIKSGVLNYIETLAPLIHLRPEQAEMAMVMLECIADSDSDGRELLHEAKNPNILTKKKFPEIVVRRMREEPRKFNLLLGSMLGVILIILIITGAYVRIEKKAKSEYETAVSRSENMIREAEDVAESNPERSKILISQSIEVLELYLATRPKSNYEAAAKSGLERIRNKEQEILKVRGTTLSPTIELSLLSENLKSDQIVDDGSGSMYFWDDSSRSIVGVSVKDLSKVTFNVENERFVRPFSTRDGVYTGFSAGGIWSGSKSEQKVVVPTDSEWGEISQVATFGNNIYLLDRGLGEIWKYAATDTGYAERKRWFGKGIVLDLSRVVDWVVDGDIWLLTSSGKLEKYSRGVPANFVLTGFPSESETGGLVDPIALSIVDDKIYVLERGAKRVVTFGLDGKYVEQYVSEDFGRASDLMVYEGKGYALVDNVIKEWEL